MENDATIVVQGAASLPGENPVAQKHITNKIFGTEGVLEYSGSDLDPSSGGLELRRHDGRVVSYDGVYFENYEKEGLGPESLLSFIDVCGAGAAGKEQLAWNGCDGQTGARVVSVIDAMYRSALSGQYEGLQVSA